MQDLVQLDLLLEALNCYWYALCSSVMAYVTSNVVSGEVDQRNGCLIAIFLIVICVVDLSPSCGFPSHSLTFKSIHSTIIMMFI